MEQQTLERVRQTFRRFNQTQNHGPPPAAGGGGPRAEEEKRTGLEALETRGNARFCRALSVSANSSALPNSMHVLMKHCWPAAHCQCHCRVDDWSIGDPLRFYTRPNLAILPPPSPLRLTCHVAKRSVALAVPRFWRSSKTTRGRLGSPRV